MGKQGYLNAFEAFRSEAEDAIMKSTTAGFGGSGYSVELFETGTFRVLWDNQIGNMYQSRGILMSIPQLADDEIGDEDTPAYFDNALMELRDKFDAEMENYAGHDCERCGGPLYIGGDWRAEDDRAQCLNCGLWHKWDARAEVWDVAQDQWETVNA